MADPSHFRPNARNLLGPGIGSGGGDRRIARHDMAEQESDEDKDEESEYRECRPFKDVFQSLRSLRYSEPLWLFLQTDVHEVERLMMGNVVNVALYLVGHGKDETGIGNRDDNMICADQLLGLLIQ